MGRKELTAWIQSNFQPNFQKIEDLASGVVYCQIIDSIYPEVKVMAKVKRDARVEVDFIHNFKVPGAHRRRASPPRIAAARRLQWLTLLQVSASARTGAAKGLQQKED